MCAWLWKIKVHHAMQYSDEYAAGTGAMERVWLITSPANYFSGHVLWWHWTVYVAGYFCDYNGQV